jgi:hypothetical protein
MVPLYSIAGVSVFGRIGLSISKCQSQIPHVIPLLLRKLEPPLKSHKHDLIEKRFIADGVASTG